METMLDNILTICSWCTKIIKKGHEHLGVSHGICQECHDRIFEEMEDSE